MNTFNFIKMHGLGNDFIVFDNRGDKIDLTPEEMKAIAHRRTGIGCDQIITMSKTANADVHMHIYNADGSEAEACGNATRCIARYIMDEKNVNKITIETSVGLLSCVETADGVKADIGPANCAWQDIPLSEERDTLNMGLEVGSLSNPVGVNVGNPHAIFFVDNADAIDLASLGPVIEHYPLFPERINVGVAQVISRNHIRFRVWERGAGITMACGTGAAASVIAGVRRDLVDRKCTVELDGGTLVIEWLENNHVTITGDAKISFFGTLERPLKATKGVAA